MIRVVTAASPATSLPASGRASRGRVPGSAPDPSPTAGLARRAGWVGLAWIVALVALSAGELAWARRQQAQNAGLERRNERVSAENSAAEAELAALRRHQVQIDALWARLNESVVVRTGDEPVTAATNRSGDPAGDGGGLFTAWPASNPALLLPPGVAGWNPPPLPSQLTFWREAGCTVQPSGRRADEVRYRVSSDRLEWHRMLPLLASYENSYALASVEDLRVTLPAGTVPMGAKATFLRWDFVVRLPAQPPAATNSPARRPAPSSR